jgi:hypothetical protein
MASTAYAGAPPPKLDATVRAYLINRGDDSTPEYKHALADLNDDHVMDAIVLLQGSLWCGNAGCRMLVFQGKDGGYSLHSTSSISRVPIRLSPEKSHGWHTLIVNTKSTGDMLMPHGSTTYPGNPSVQPAASKPQLDAAKILIY